MEVDLRLLPIKMSIAVDAQISGVAGFLYHRAIADVAEQSHRGLSPFI